MFCLRRFLLSPRTCQVRRWSSNAFFCQLNQCADEEQVFDLVGKNKTKLSEKHVEKALDILWQFQKKKPDFLKDINDVRDHPHFLILRILAENKIGSMNNEALVNMLYNLLKFNVDAHDSLVAEIVMEGWKRLDSMNMPELSKFSLCLHEQQMSHSPLMGQIAEIVNKNLASMQATRVLSVLMVSISHVISHSFRDRLIQKAEFLLDTVDSIPLNHARRLMETSLLMADEFDPHQALGMIEAMQEIECRSSQLIQKVSSFLLKHLDLYSPRELARVTQSTVALRFPNPDLYNRLHRQLINRLKVKITPSEVAILIQTLSTLPSSFMDEAVVSTIDAILPQCSLSNLSCFATALVKWFKQDKSTQSNLSVTYGTLLQKVNALAHHRLETVHELDLLLEEIKYASGEWFEEELLEDALAAFQRLKDQISATNVVEFSSFLTRASYLCTPLLDRIADVTLQHSDKIYISGTYSLLLPFAVLNYDPPQSEEFFKACIGRVTSHLDCFEPHLLVLLAFTLAMAEYFPENLMMAIFNVDFLTKLDAQLEIGSHALNRRVRSRLMEVNRAVCLACPEFQVPWFHERYCQQLQQRSSRRLNTLHQQIHRMLGEILGGSHFARASVLTPYYYVIVSTPKVALWLVILRRQDAPEKRIMPGKSEGSRKRRRANLRWIDSTREATIHSLEDLSKAVNNRKFWRSLIHRVTQSQNLLALNNHPQTHTHIVLVRQGMPCRKPLLPNAMFQAVTSI
ncbi:FAST kinase domain-containing protein 1, mitochondrial isoform X3 [Paroedura picta]|uniref:FAST kinase domain-containing protein 1, mitochondrial isoform X3 n=1 Tax=Paroedura picta TaxID=143630 RepID=UPI0040563F08